MTGLSVWFRAMDRRSSTIERRREKRHAAETVPDLRDEDWYQFLVEIDGLLGNPRLQWAEPVLRNIRDTVEQTHRVTDLQIAAVVNIERARKPLHDFARRWPWPVD